MKLEILDASYHRNGISGIGFWAVLFKDMDEHGKVMIASLFDVEEFGFCAVYAVGDGIVIVAGARARGRSNVVADCDLAL